MTKFLGAIGIVFFAIAMRKLLQTHRHPKDRKIIYVVGGLLLFGSLSMVLSSSSLTEKEYVQEVVNIVVDSDNKIRNTDAYSDDELKDTANYLGKQMKALKRLKPPRSLPQDVKDAHEGLYEGMGRIKQGIEQQDFEKVQAGQTIVSMTLVLYNDYIDNHPELFDE